MVCCSRTATATTAPSSQVVTVLTQTRVQWVLGMEAVLVRTLAHVTLVSVFVLSPENLIAFGGSSVSNLFVWSSQNNYTEVGLSILPEDVPVVTKQQERVRLIQAESKEHLTGRVP